MYTCTPMKLTPEVSRETPKLKSNTKDRKKTARVQKQCLQKNLYTPYLLLHAMYLVDLSLAPLNYVLSLT
jgi:hypothetical protein